MRGVQAGVERALRYGLEPRDFLIDETVRPLTYVISSWPEELNERFLVLFVENVIVAAIARSIYSERFPTFEVDELRAFLAHSAAFFNSFKHR
jgi:hypothetical protein